MILMTRPKVFAEEFKAILGLERSDLINCSIFEVFTCGHDRISIHNYDALIFTSRLAVLQIENRLVDRDIKCFCIGNGTSKTLRNLGFRNVVSANGSVQELLELLSQFPLYRMLYLSGSEITFDLSLWKPKFIDRLIVYRTVPIKKVSHQVLQLFKSEMKWTVPFFSSRSYKVFEQLILKSNLSKYCSNASAIFISENVYNKNNLIWNKYNIAKIPNLLGVAKAYRSLQVN